jgi:hypothetical protein
VKKIMNADQILQAKSFYSDGMQNLLGHDVRGGKNAPQTAILLHESDRKVASKTTFPI